MKSEYSVLSAAKEFVSNREYKKALSCYHLFKVMNADLADTVRANEIFLQKKIKVSSDVNQIIMEIPVFDNMDYTLECFWRVTKNSPFDVRVDIIQGAAGKSYLLAWFDTDDLKAYRNLISTNSALDIKHFLEETGFFDAQFYQNQYKPALNGLDALTHFVQYGLAEGKLPARWFDLHVGTDQTISKIVTEAMHGRASRTTCPKVSVLVPVFNNAQYLHECIGSIINQTLEDIEIIIINDGSTDQKAIDILNDYANKDDRIRIIHKKNTGYGHSMNCGLYSAKGEYIGIVESDDYILPNMFGVLYNQAQENKCEIVRSDPSEFRGDGGGRIFKKIASSSSGNLYNKDIDPYVENAYFRAVSLNPTGIYLKTFLKKNNIDFNETPGASFQDIGFFFKVSITAKKIRIVNDSFYMVRRDNENSSVFSCGKVYASCNEFKSIRLFIEKNDGLKKYIPHLHFKKYLSYKFHLGRLMGDEKIEFKHIFKKDFEDVLSNKEIDDKMFLAKELQYIHSLCGHECGNTKFYAEKCECKISVVVPVYNCEPYLDFCIQSIVSQSVEDIEIICVDDGSSDASLSILKRYAQEDGRIRVFHQQNLGAGAARNKALASACGEFIAFMDSDDFYPNNNCLELLYNNAKKYKMQISGGNLLYFKNGKTERNASLKDIIFKTEKVVEYANWQYDFGYQCFIFSRELLKHHSISFPSYLRFQDPPFFVKSMICAGVFVVCPGDVYCYRVSHKSIDWTDKKISDLIYGVCEVMALAKNNKLGKLHNVAIKQLIHFVKQCEDRFDVKSKIINDAVQSFYNKIDAKFVSCEPNLIHELIFCLNDEDILLHIKNGNNPPRKKLCDGQLFS